MSLNNGNKTGKFITFEGIDYSGKSVQAQLLCQKLQDLRLPVVAIRDPGATRISEEIRRILLDNKNHEMSYRTELLLYEAARAQMVHEIIAPALAKGQVVICDRFFDSTTAYQGYGRQLDLDVIKQANMLGANEIVPDLTFLIDIDVHTACARRIKQEMSADRLEAEGLEFQNRVRQGYLQIAGEYKQRIYVLNGEQSIEKLSLEIIQHVKNRLKLFA
ncbi:MAG TPA: dTMP kinase [bacterium]|nr:dTMP kinase [bacterium]HPN45182.1 dTMP kinase [bacterium]